MTAEPLKASREENGEEDFEIPTINRQLRRLKLYQIKSITVGQDDQTDGNDGGDASMLLTTKMSLTQNIIY